MSQAKVDKYKNEKKNRKEIMKKQKIQSRLRKTVAAVVGVVIIGWVGYSAYGTFVENQPAEKVDIDYSAMTSLYTGISGIVQVEE